MRLSGCSAEAQLRLETGRSGINSFGKNWKSIPKTNVSECLISVAKQIFQGRVPLLLTLLVLSAPKLMCEWKFLGSFPGLPEVYVPVIIYFTRII